MSTWLQLINYVKFIARGVCQLHTKCSTRLTRRALKDFLHFFTLLSKKKKNPKNLSTRCLAVTHGTRCAERGAQSARTVLHILRGHVQM